LVMALCRLHNFCIDKNEAITKPTASDTLDIALHGGIDLRAFQNIDQDDGDFVYDNDRDQIDHLIDGGHHPNDVPDNVRRQQHRLIQNMHQPTPLPCQVMHNYVEDQGFRRPFPRTSPLLRPGETSLYVRRPPIAAETTNIHQPPQRVVVSRNGSRMIKTSCLIKDFCI
jgi:hypothetical protein